MRGREQLTAAQTRASCCGSGGPLGRDGISGLEDTSFAWQSYAYDNYTC